MKTINETFTDEEHKMLSKIKGKQSWHDFILTLIQMKGGSNVRNEDGKNKL